MAKTTGYEIFQNHSLQGLLDQLPRQMVLPDWGDDLPLFILQSRNMEEWVRLRLTESQGFCGNLNFCLPEAALRRLSGAFAMGRAAQSGQSAKTVLFMDDLKVVLYRLLEKKLTAKDLGVYASLRDYVFHQEASGGADPSVPERLSSSRLYSLANAVAGVFHYYAMNLGSLADAWEAGASADVSLGLQFTDEAKEHQLWQSQLWREIFDPEGPYIHLGRLLHRISLNKDQPVEALPAVTLFGSAFLSGQAFHFFHYISQFTSVSHFLLSPANPAALLSPAPHPLVEAWGALGLGFETLLSQNPEIKRHPVPEFQVASEGLLGHLQKGIWQNQWKEIDPDASPTIQLLGVSGLRRELEVLADEVLELLSKPRSDGSFLRPQDIGVLAPDLEPYEPFIETVFASIPHNSVDLAFKTPLLEATTLLLALPHSRFSLEELFPLFSNPCFQEARGMEIGEDAVWKDFCHKAGISWALDTPHQRDLGLVGGPWTTWEGAFTRLLAGLAWGEGPASLPDGQALWSLTSPAVGESAPLGRLIAAVRDLRASLSAPKPVELRQWVQYFQNEVVRPFLGRSDQGGDEREFTALQQALANLLNLAATLDAGADRLGGGKIPFGVFRSLLEEQLESTSSWSRGSYLVGGVTFSALRPLRALPFRVIFLLGMNEGAYPSPDDTLSFDLREFFPQDLDFSRRSSEKYALLETVVSVKDKLVVFYQDHDPVDGEALQSCLPISQLAESLRTSSGPLPTQSHPLQGYSAKYFQSSSPLCTYDKRRFAEALAFYQSSKLDRQPLFAAAVLPEPLADLGSAVSFGDLESFLRHPLRFFFHKTLGIRLGNSQEAVPDAESVTPLFFDRRDWWMSLLYQGLEKLGSDQSPESLESDLLAQKQVELWQLQGRMSGHPVLAQGEKAELSNSAQSYTQARGELFTALSDNSPGVWQTRRIIFDSAVSTLMDEGDFLTIPAPVWTVDSRCVRLEGEGPSVIWNPSTQKAVLLSETVKKAAGYENLWKSALLMTAFETLGLRDRLTCLLVLSRDLLKVEMSPDSQSAQCLMTLYARNLASPFPLYQDLWPEPPQVKADGSRVPKEGVSVESLTSAFESSSDQWEDQDAARNPNKVEHCPYAALAFPTRIYDFDQPSMRDFLKHFAYPLTLSPLQFKESQ